VAIYVGKFNSGGRNCVILAESYEMAWAYFLGRRCGSFTIETYTEDDIKDQLVVPLSD